ncbi:hypothetical protein [Pseudomonas syringae]|uniref:hypothetical protein n=1 Tax=Pseudomonas syringae TaxID=317 RepID=UPI003204F4B3
MNMINTPIPVSLMGKTFTANQDRMWNLNEAHRELGLPDTKAPSQWRNAVADELRASANLQIIDKVGTLATEAGTIAYAMWVSTNFYLMVVHAFVAMRNNALGDLRSAETLLDENMPKASVFDMRARGAGLTWSDACKGAGIQQPRLALDVLVSMGSFVYPVDSFGTREGSPRPKKQGFEVGAFVKVSSDFGNREGWRVKTRGLDWLRKEAEGINLTVAETKAAKARAKRKDKTDRWGRVAK